MFVPMFDFNYWILIGPALLFALWAQAQVRGAYMEFARVRTLSGLTGADVARDLLRRAGLHNVEVERIGGQLTDHYDPRTHTVRLSAGVYDSASIAAVGIAAHECGHALQHAHGYAPLYLRNAIIPVTQIASQAAFPLFFLGLVFQWAPIVWIGVYLFLAAVLFQLITLPVEFDASARALRVLRTGGYLSSDELGGARRVLSAAALTYVAAALMAIMQFVYLLGLARRND
ncbi:MAG: zinc metallopeptidase [Firmicutes bacterium]|nr:zinc metallopeptidase [Bacillota bacterium]